MDKLTDNGCNPKVKLLQRGNDFGREKTTGLCGGLIFRDRFCFDDLQESNCAEQEEEVHKESEKGPRD